MSSIQGNLKIYKEKKVYVNKTWFISILDWNKTILCKCKKKKKEYMKEYIAAPFEKKKNPKESV